MIWKTYKLDQIKAEGKYTLVGGPFGSDLTTRDYVEEGIPVLRGVNLPFQKRFSHNDLVFVSEEKAQKLKSNLAFPKDILFTQRGTLGQVGLISEGFYEKYVVSQSQMKLTVNPKLVIPEFVYYFFSSKEGRNELQAHSITSGVPHINLEILKNLEISTPPLPIQRRIVSILSAYDDLIENNLKRIKLLEEKAFLSYKGIVKSEKMVTESKLEDIIQTIKRNPKILKSDYKEKGEYPIIDQSTDFIGGFTDEKESIYEDVPMIVFGDHTRILKYINFPFACGADGTQLVKPNNSNVSIAYLYFEIISCNLSNYHYARHFKFLKEQIIRLPNESVMLEYKIETDKIFNLIQILRLQNAKLREARDILLPRLMSGEIEV